MPVREVPLSSVGLLSVAEAAAALDAAERTVQKWIQDGLLPAVVAGAGMRTVHLLRLSDVKAFEKPARGRPVKDPPKKPVRGTKKGKGASS
jgi:excisionase family DNA binding protein